MTDSTITQQIIKQLDQLPAELQRKVLDFAQALSLPLPKGTPGKQLLPFAGVIEPDDMQTITQAIESGCEKVDTEVPS